MTGVLVLPQRQTALVAKQAAEVDVLSGGRLRLGVGIGWNQVEYDALGVPFEQRGALLDPAGGRAAASCGPSRSSRTTAVRPDRGSWVESVTRQGDPDLVRRRCGGRYCVVPDGSVTAGCRSPPGRQGSCADRAIREAAAEAGRDPATIGIEARLTLGAVPEQDWRAFADGWRDLGATHLGVNTMNMGLSKPEDHAAVLRDVLPRAQLDQGVLAVEPRMISGQGRVTISVGSVGVFDAAAEKVHAGLDDGVDRLLDRGEVEGLPGGEFGVVEADHPDVVGTRTPSARAPSRMPKASRSVTV